MPTTPGEEPIRFYGRRKGKPLNTGRLSLLETHLPKVAMALPTGPLDPVSLFAPKPEEIWLEIGFGGGEHLAAQAAAHPDVGFIGSEVFLNGVSSLMKEMEARAVGNNVRVLHDDVRLLMPTLPDASLARIYLMFPDPWPKTRHAKRRFISPKMLDEIARLLRDGGELRVASDHPVYVDWTLRHAPVHPAFRWDVTGPADWRERPSDGFPTRYEQKAIAVGRPPAYMRFVRKPRAQ